MQISRWDQLRPEPITRLNHYPVIHQADWTVKLRLNRKLHIFLYIPGNVGTCSLSAIGLGMFQFQLCTEEGDRDWICRQHKYIPHDVRFERQCAKTSCLVICSNFICIIFTGIWLSAFALGNFVGPTVAGLLVNEIGFRRTTFIFFVLYVAMAVLDAIEAIGQSARQRAASAYDQH